MKRLIIVGSPRTSGRSAHLAEMLFEANIDEHPEDELFLVPLSEIEVGPCIACDACREKSRVILKGDDGAEVTVERHRCVFDDDMQTLYDLIDDVDEVTVVSPVFFSGSPAQLKCLLDRLQPYYWASNRGHAASKRPLTLHVIGEGGDPHGYDALVSEVKASFAVAGFSLERVLDWVGKITEDGEITAEAKEVRFNAEGNKQRPKLSVTLAADKATSTKTGEGKAASAKASQKSASQGAAGASKPAGRSGGRKSSQGKQSQGKQPQGKQSQGGKPQGRQSQSKSKKGKRRG